jgi:hypothetical protein
LKALWLGFEGFLLRQFPDAEQIATPSWEPVYEQDRDAWPDFLQGVGYRRLNKMAFVKDVGRDASIEAAFSPGDKDSA